LERIFSTLGVNCNSKRVVIKLNLCSLKTRETGATSDPVVVKHLIEYLNEKGSSVRLVESDSTGKSADLAFKYLGFKSLERKYDVKCINLSTDEFVVKNIDGYYLNSVRVPRTIENADLFITHPKMKTHSDLRVFMTGALKNQFGCLMGRNKEGYHARIHEVIADANQAFIPDLAIMDSIIAMTGYGPTNGRPQRLNLLMASRDPVAIDAVAARILQFNPSFIKYIKLTSKKGLGNISYRLVGDRVENALPGNRLSNFIMRSFATLSSMGIKGVNGV
jgi:uncharacterized protein (DUF362 family)